MRINYFSNSIIPSRSANSIHVMKMCQALAKKGHEVLLLAPDKQDLKTDKQIKDTYSYYGVDNNFQIKMLPWLKIKGTRHIYGLLGAMLSRFNKADLVLGRFLPGCYYSALLGIPTIYEAHQPVNESALKKMLNKLLANNKFLSLVAISNALKEWFLEEFHVPANKIVIAPDAADDIYIENDQVVNKQLQVGYVGQLYPGKGLELVFGLAEKCSWAEFHLVGGMPGDIEKWEESFENLQNVTLHGFVTPAEVGQYLAKFDILLAPYQKKVTTYGNIKSDIAQWMSPLKVFEYMAAAKPIICSDLPVLREVLEHERTALLLPPDNLGKWVGALDMLNSNREYANTLALNARREFEEKYTWDARAEKMADLFPKEVNK